MGCPNRLQTRRSQAAETASIAKFPPDTEGIETAGESCPWPESGPVVYDANAAGSIGDFVDWRVVASIRDSMISLPDWAKAYRNFAAAFVVLYERARAETPMQPGVKEVDYPLWQS